jgi:HNH endonuclease
VESYLSNLPISNDLDISIFSRLFENTASSYKFVFFISLLDILKNDLFEVCSPISLKDLAIEMLVVAWYPHSAFRLSFGSQDVIAQKLDALGIGANQSLLKITENNKNILREDIREKMLNDNYDLIKYVPFRLIRPFFPELTGLKDHQVNRQIKEISEQTFESRKPLYKFNSDATAIVIHPEWLAYIQRHYQIIRGWVSWGWLRYMQRNNFNTPALSNKLFPPRERESLQKQTSYWKTIIANSGSLKCIYSNQILALDDISLDHYLPWSFLAHNQLWNLIPTSQSVNSSKSNKIPDDAYFNNLVATQHLGITTFYKYSSLERWRSYMEPYFVDLGFLSESDLLDHNKFHQQYQLRIQPLIALATSQGFEGGWNYKTLVEQ